jgi:predicted ATP-dependent serine protease
MNVWKCSKCNIEVQGYYTKCPNCGEHNSLVITDKHPVSLIRPINE